MRREARIGPVCRNQRKNDLLETGHQDLVRASPFSGLKWTCRWGPTMTQYQRAKYSPPVFFCSIRRGRHRWVCVYAIYLWRVCANSLSLGTLSGARWLAIDYCQRNLGDRVVCLPRREAANWGCLVELFGGIGKGAVGVRHCRWKHIASGLIAGVTDECGSLHLRGLWMRHGGYIDHFMTALRAWCQHRVVWVHVPPNLLFAVTDRRRCRRALPPLFGEFG